MSRMVAQLREIIENHMQQDQHHVLSYSKYKENTRLIVKVCDFVDLFSTVNQKIIIKDVEKLPKRMSKLSQLFKQASEALSLIERLIKEIRIIPIKHKQRINSGELAFHTLWSYYYGLGEYERSSNDTPNEV